MSELYELNYHNQQNEEECVAAVRENGSAIFSVKYQTEKICLAAVRNNPWVLSHVENKTPIICLAAVQKCGYTLEFVGEDNQTEELCLAAVQSRGNALAFVRQDLMTYKVCEAALNQNGFAIQYIHPTIFTQQELYKLYKTAVKQNCRALEFIDEEYQTQGLCLAAIKSKTGTVLDLIDYQDPVVSLEAVRSNSDELQFVKNKTPEIYVAAIKAYLGENDFEGDPKDLIINMFGGFVEMEVLDCKNDEKKYVRTNKTVYDYIRHKYEKIASVHGDLKELVKEPGFYFVKTDDNTFEVYEAAVEKVVQKGWISNFEVDELKVNKIEVYRVVNFTNNFI